MSEVASEKTIMIVDDSPTLRGVVKELLQGEGYQVVEAEDGQKALSKAAKHSFNLILCDVNMPIMDGVAFLSEIKQDRNHADVPVIMLTTESDRNIKEIAKAAGATGWIIKPFNQKQLLNAVSQLAL